MSCLFNYSRARAIFTRARVLFLSYLPMRVAVSSASYESIRQCINVSARVNHCLHDKKALPLVFVNVSFGADFSPRAISRLYIAKVTQSDFCDFPNLNICEIYLSYS